MGIIPFTFVNPSDREGISQGDFLIIDNLSERIKEGGQITLKNETKGIIIPLECKLGERERELLLVGGLLRYIKSKA